MHLHNAHCTDNIFNNARCSAFISNRYLLSIQVSEVSLLSLYSYFMRCIECTRLDTLWRCISWWDEMRKDELNSQVYVVFNWSEILFCSLRSKITIEANTVYISEKLSKTPTIDTRSLFLAKTQLPFNKQHLRSSKAMRTFERGSWKCITNIMIIYRKCSLSCLG